RGGIALICIVVVQLMLGGISLAVRTPPAITSPSAKELQSQAVALRPALHALVTTAHQTTAAVLLGTATLLAVWSWRRLSTGEIENPAIEAVVETIGTGS